MKLSEAIRLGAMEGPQGFWSDSVTADDSRCALGCAAWAAGLVQATTLATYMALKQKWPLLNQVVASPTPMPEWAVAASDFNHQTALDVIWRLNDVCKWTREQIADWVATIEAQQEQPAQPQPVPVTVTP